MRATVANSDIVQTTAPNMCRASATAVMGELPIPRDDGYMPAYAGLGKRWLRCGCGWREGVGSDIEPASAASGRGFAPRGRKLEYAPRARVMGSKWMERK
jgi:hypothetical protein